MASDLENIADQLLLYQLPVMDQKFSFKTRYILGISLVSAMGGLLFGYDWVVIGGAKPFYEKFFDIVDYPRLQGWAMSCALAGCLLGSLLSGLMSDRFGRKRLLITAALIFVFSALGTGASDHFTPFVLYRILGGVAIGLASNLSPMYIAEITPASIRGGFVSINQLTIVIGILLAQVANWLIAEPVPEGASAQEILLSWNGQRGWRWMFWAELVPASLFFILMWFVPESPRWLAKRKKHEQAMQVLSRLGDSEYARQEVAEIENTLRNDTEKVNYRSLLSPGVSGVLIIGVVLAVFQQWCGINVIFNYAEEIFAAAGYGVSDTLFNIVITGSVNLIFTFVAIYLVDKIGRKGLMLLGAGGLAGIYALLGSMYYFDFKGIPVLVFILLAIACYSMTLAPVTWVLLSEIFPNRIRGAALAVATFSLWAASFILVYTFPFINRMLSTGGAIWLYGLVCLGGFIFIRKRVVETKGKSLEQIERELVNRIT
jgi:SP family sugar porter-like MFS transporter